MLSAWGIWFSNGLASQQFERHRRVRRVLGIMYQLAITTNLRIRMFYGQPLNLITGWGVLSLLPVPGSYLVDGRVETRLLHSVW